MTTNVIYVTACLIVVTTNVIVVVTCLTVATTNVIFVTTCLIFVTTCRYRCFCYLKATKLEIKTKIVWDDVIAKNNKRKINSKSFIIVLGKEYTHQVFET